MNAHGVSGILALAVAAGVLAGCQSTTTLTKRSELAELHSYDQVRILSRDSVQYDLLAVSLHDTAVYGKGTALAGGLTVKFDGEIPLANVRYIQSTSVSVFKTFLALGGVGFVVGTAAAYLKEKSTGGLTMGTAEAWYDPRLSGYSGGSGGSCPYIYSWNGSRYVLEGEAYAVAWGKALEMESVTMLPSLHPESGVLSVRCTNERPETHYYNALSLETVETGENVEVVADPQGALWPVQKLEPPRRATDGNQTDVLAGIGTMDGSCWESPLRDILPGSGFEDEITLVMPKAAGDRAGTLVVRAINTRIFDVVLRRLSGLLGDDYLAFVRAIEEDAGLREILKEWTADASLKVAVWDGRGWRASGAMLPEGNAVPFTKGVRIDARGIEGDSVTLRLSCLAGVWNIDGVGIDWTSVTPLNPVRAQLLSAAGPGNRNIVGPLEKADEQYVTVLPGQQIECKFRAREPEPGTKTTCALRVRGYLHEWSSVGRPPSAEQTLASSMTGAAKIAYVKALLRTKSVLLPPIYAEWRQAR